MSWAQLKLVARRSPATQLMKLSSAWALSGSSILHFVVSMGRVRIKRACYILSDEQWTAQPEQVCPYRLPGRSKGTQARGNQEKERPGNVSGMGSLVSSATLLLSSCGLKKVTGFPWVGVLIRNIRRLNQIIPKAPSLSNILQFSVKDVLGQAKWRSIQRAAVLDSLRVPSRQSEHTPINRVLPLHNLWRLRSGRTMELESKVSVIAQKLFTLAGSLDFKHYSWSKRITQIFSVFLRFFT